MGSGAVRRPVPFQPNLVPVPTLRAVLGIPGRARYCGGKSLLISDFTYIWLAKAGRERGSGPDGFVLATGRIVLRLHDRAAVANVPRSDSQVDSSLQRVRDYYSGQVLAVLLTMDLRLLFFFDSVLLICCKPVYDLRHTQAPPRNVNRKHCVSNYSSGLRQVVGSREGPGGGMRRSWQGRRSIPTLI
jgi:hypothetical protein